MKDLVLFTLLAASGILNVILLTVWRITSRKLSDLENCNRRFNRCKSEH